jgi:tryptophanyl-tRNA synthetase
MTILSGIQPTSNIHLGNYLGAIRNWVALSRAQNATPQNSLFCVVDLHAITVAQEPAKLRQAVLEAAAAYLACGLDPAHNSIFVQSYVSGHAELGWILGCQTPLGWLYRMTQFKDKAGKDRDNSGLGLLAYPALMAADILLYKATQVPVGEDQKQHVELTRDIAGAFNHQFGENFFPLPEPLMMGEATRVMSLRDGTKKMSKSDASDQSRLNLLDDADTIADKIKRAKTDPDALPSDAAGLANRPEARNLLTIYAAIQGKSLADVLPEVGGSQFSGFKAKLTAALVAHLTPIGQQMQKLLADKAYLQQVLTTGAANANAIAKPTLQGVMERMGLR